MSHKNPPKFAVNNSLTTNYVYIVLKNHVMLYHSPSLVLKWGSFSRQENSSRNSFDFYHKYKHHLPTTTYIESSTLAYKNVKIVITTVSLHKEYQSEIRQLDINQNQIKEFLRVSGFCLLYCSFSKYYTQFAMISFQNKYRYLFYVYITFSKKNRSKKYKGDLNLWSMCSTYMIAPLP